MSDEILNTLGFDVAPAISALDKLDARFAAFGSNLNVIAGNLKTFNSAGVDTVAAMKSLSSNSTSTAAAMSRISASAAQNINSLLGMAAAADKFKAANLGLVGGASTGKSVAGGAFDNASLGVNKVTASVQALQNASRLGVGSYGNTLSSVSEQARSASAAIGKTRDEVQYATLSWQTFSRVIQTQALLRGFNMIRNATVEAFESFRAFSKQVSEIQAIGPERNFRQIADDVRAMSDSFNQPLSRVAEAQYQVISDQFVSAADRANILTAANQLAKTGAEDLAASAQLLTGALNAYNESSSMAGLRSAQFFETIKLGRLRAGELGGALGRIQSIGHELGVSMEELDSSLVAITIGGVKASEAATQMRGVMSALLKPTEEMKKAFKSIGVESGQVAIATYGLQGTLEALWQAIGGDPTTSAKLFANIRGLAGDFRLAGSGAQKFKESMEALNKIDQTTLSKSFEQFTSSDMEKVTKELNKVKNFMTADFGKQLTEQLGTLVSALGGSNGVIGILSTLTSELPKDAIAFGLLSAALLVVERRAAAASTQMTLFQTSTSKAIFNFKSFTGVLSILAFTEIAKMLGSGFGNAYADMLTAPQEKIRNQLNAETEFRKQKSDASVRIEQRQADEMFQGLRQLVAKKNSEYLKDVDAYNAAQKRVEKTTQQSFDKVLQLRQKLTQELLAASEAAAKNAAAVPDRVSALQQSNQDLKFNQQAQRFDPSGQYMMYLTKMREAASEYLKIQSSAKDDNEQKLADAAWSRAQAYKQLAESAAKTTGQEGIQRQAGELGIELNSRQIEALKKYQQIQKQVSAELEGRGHAAEAHNSDLEEKRLAIEEKLKTTAKGDDGEVTFKGTKQLQQDLIEATQLIQKFKKDYGTYGQDFLKNVMGDPKAFEGMKREAERSLASANLKNIEYVPQALDNLHKNLQASFEKMKLSIPVLARLESFSGLEVMQVGIDKVMTAAADKFAKQVGSTVQKAESTANIMAAKDVLGGASQSLLNKLPKSFDQLGPFSGSNATNAARENVEGIVVEFNRLTRSASITDAELEKLQQRVNGIDWKQLLGGGVVGDVKKIKALDQLLLMEQSLMKIKEAQDRQKATPQEGSKQLQGEATQAIEDAKQKAAVLGEKLSSAATVNYSSLVAQLNAARDAMIGVAMAASQIPGMSASYASSGGMMYFAGGGLSRGTDTRPAMLSDGESVINASASRRWYTQLTAMNAGMSPVYRSAGGTTITIGDVNVTGGPTGEKTARAIASELRRELRRGSVGRF